MFPNHGRGFIWDTITIVGNEAHAVIFVPESKKLFNVAISTKEVDVMKLHPTVWLQWKQVGARDATKPIPIGGVSLVDTKEDNGPIHPEFVHHTTFKSILLFPDRPDQMDFVGKNNAWSPFVGVVECEEGTEISRGLHCTGYIERDDLSTDSIFRVNTATLKFLEGFATDEDRKAFEGLTSEIELAREEAVLLASKGIRQGYDSQVLPVQRKSENRLLKSTECDGPSKYGQKANVPRSNTNRPRWNRHKSKKEIADVELMRNFAKDNRYHEWIVYKKHPHRGFVGWTPLIGSVQITAYSPKQSDQLVEVGQTIIARVESNNRTQKFVVDEISEIMTISPTKFSINGNNLLIQCRTLNLADYTPVNELHNLKRCGVIEHPILSKIFVLEEEVMKEEWKGKRVTARLLHYEGIEEETPQRIRLHLERLERLVDVDTFDEKDESDVKKMKKKEEEKEEIGRTNVFIDLASGSGFNSSCEREGYGGYEKGGGGNSPKMPAGRAFQSAVECHGFGSVREQSNPPILGRGILVLYSKKTAFFYMKTHELVGYEGDASLRDLHLGESAEFEITPSIVPFTIVPGTLKLINDIFDLKMRIDNDELCIRVRGSLTPHKDVFECSHVSDVRLKPSQTDLKLCNGNFIDKSRLAIDHNYDVFVTFSSEELQWEFACVDETADSYILEEEDDIARFKREQRNKEKEKAKSKNEEKEDEKEELKRMLKSVWEFEEVRAAVKAKNIFLYWTIADWKKNEAEVQNAVPG